MFSPAHFPMSRHMIKKERCYGMLTELWDVRKLTRVFCRQCSDQVALVTLYEAVKLSGASSRTIHQWIEETSIHFMETADGLVLICPASLLGQNRNAKRLSDH
jgi:hypothetical protein